MQTNNQMLQTTEERIKSIIIDQLCVREDLVTDSARIIDDLGADHLDLAELTMALEEEFEIDITDAEIESAKTVAALAALVKRLTDEAA